MQVAPLTHRLGLVVALLPTVQPVLSRGVCLLLARLSAIGRVLGGKPPFERVQDRWNVIDELRASNRGRGGQVRIRIDRASPGAEDRLASQGQIGSQVLERVGRLIGVVHCGNPAVPP